MHEVHPVPQEWADKALIDKAKYEAMYRRSIEDPDGFWREEAKRIAWIAPFETVKDTSFDRNDLHIRWFAGGKLNIAANCLDRHQVELGETVAIYWEPDDPAEGGRQITYRELYRDVGRFANALKSKGVRPSSPGFGLTEMNFRFSGRELTISNGPGVAET